MPGLDNICPGLKQASKAGNLVFAVRHRATIAEVNAGFTLTTPPQGMAVRLVGARAIAVGGAVADVTTVDVLDDTTKLVAFAQASLTQSTVVVAGETGGTVLADGASFAALDANEPVTVGKTGSDVTGATHIDFLVEFTLE